MNTALALAAIGSIGACDRRATVDRPPGPAPAASPAAAAPPASRDTTPPAAAPDRREVVAHMREHFSRIIAVRDAVIAGDVEAASRPARWLAEHGAPRDVPDEWIPFIVDLRVLSAGLVEADSVDELARSTGVVARTCSGCHEALSARIDYIPGIAPPAHDSRGRMHRHKWAMERLWSGLVLPNELAWQRGAEALAETPFPPSSFLGDLDTRTELASRSAHLQALGQRAAEVDELDRSKLYAELLTTCAACHRQARVTIGRSLEPSADWMLLDH